MRILSFILIGIFVVVVAINFVAGQSSKPVSKAAAQTASASVGFGLNVFSNLNRTAGGENIFISPSSIAWCLSMVLNGARGQTKTEIAEALQVDGIPLTEINLAYGEWKSSWGTIDPKVEIDVANSIWSRKGIGIRPEFVETNKRFFGSEVQELDFNDPRSLSTINNWVKDKTRGKIEKILDQISADSVIFLINAVYFNGKWANAFDPARTKEETFVTGRQQEKKLPMMRQRGTFAYQEQPGFQAVRLPYGNGRISMHVFLPSSESNPDKFYAMLTAQNWKQWMNQYNESEGELALPRFDVRYESTLNQTLKALGMNSAFDPTSADFGAMIQTTGRAFISTVKHKAFAEVTEEGTEAAAATSTEVRVVSMPSPSKTFRMIVNRPFFFAIRDDATGLILFLGSITNP